MKNIASIIRNKTSKIQISMNSSYVYPKIFKRKHNFGISCEPWITETKQLNKSIIPTLASLNEKLIINHKSLFMITNKR